MGYARRICFGLVLWATSQFTKIDATTVAFLGISILLATSVLVWDDVKK